MRERMIGLGILAALLVAGLITAPVGASEKDEQAIRGGSQKFVEAFNRRDARAIGAMFTDDGDYTDETGTVYSGRKAITDDFARYFATSKGRTIRVHVDAVRFVTPEVAIVDGTSAVEPPAEGPPVIGRYTSVRVKRGGKWLVAAVRESAVPVPSNYEHLQQLEWMLGEWLDADEKTSVHTTVRWGANKNFLIREFTVKVADRSVMSGTQRIGWDPKRKQIKSWVFDSEGGVSEGLWVRDGNRWVIRTSANLRDGSHGSATGIITMIDDDTFTWQSRNRVIDGEAQDDIEEVRVVRLPPKPM